MNEHQFKNVLSLETKDRYIHFVGKVVDWEELWILGTEEYMYTRKTQEDLEYLPVWPHQDYADSWNTNIEVNLESIRIDLYKFMEKWIPGLVSDGIKIGVFPNMEGTVWIIEPVELLEELKKETQKYE